MLLSILALGCGAPQTAGEPLPESPAEAAPRVLAAAEELEREHKSRQAFAAYHQILQRYPGTPESKTAADRIRRARQQSAMRLKKAARKGAL